MKINAPLILIASCICFAATCGDDGDEEPSNCYECIQYLYKIDKYNQATGKEAVKTEDKCTSQEQIDAYVDVNTKTEDITGDDTYIKNVWSMTCTKK